MKRHVKLILICAIIFALVASSVFLIINADHECHEGARCRICLGIENAFNILKNVVAAVSVSLCVSLFLRIGGERAAPLFVPASTSSTPIKLKVKLNN